MNDSYIQIKEAAKMLGVSKLTLRNWDKSGKLIAYRHPLNNYRVYKLEDIEKILKKIETVDNSQNIERINFYSPAKRKTKISKKTYNLKELLQKNNL